MNFPRADIRMAAELWFLFHGGPDVYFDGDVGGAFLVRHGS